MVIPTTSDSWAGLITPILIGVYIAIDRFSVWKATRARKQLGQTIDEVHSLVNGRSTADAAKIQALCRRVYELTGEPPDMDALVAANKVVRDMKASDAAAAARLKADEAAATVVEKPK